MPPPLPLTACDPPQLDWSRGTVPAATNFGDIYFSVDGGLAETESVYLAGCGLPERWLQRMTFTIGELGFGSGLNFLATWRLWEQTCTGGAHLHFVSIEKFPFAAFDLSRALTAWPELKPYADRLVALWPGPVKGAHTLHMTPNITLTLLHDDVNTALQSLTGEVDAWFLDGFSPAKNPAMWSPTVMQEIARLSAPGATIGTFTVAGAVRQALKTAGFYVQKKDGFGRKRQRLEAVFPGVRTVTPLPVSPVILGAGIAGASLAKAFLRRGIIPTVIDSGDNTAASGNAAALVKPRLDLQDRPESRFFLRSYLYALRAYAETSAIMQTGIFHGAKTEKERERFEKLATLSALPPNHMRYEKGPYGLEGLTFPKGLVINPVKTCEDFLAGATRIKARAHNIQATENGAAVLDEDGNIIASGSHIYLAIGAGIRDFSDAADMALRYSRGQISEVTADVNHTVTYGGYAIPLSADTALLGATHARMTSADPYTATQEDDQANIENFVSITGQSAALIDGASRASIRVTRANTLPLIEGQEGPITTMTGLGSRGFCFAPLLAEDIVSKACHEIRTTQVQSFLSPI